MKPLRFGTHFPELTPVYGQYQTLRDGQKPSFIGLIDQLNLEATFSYFDPIAASRNDQSPDEFFANNAKFQQLESALAEEIRPETAVDMLTLIINAGRYWPTQKVIKPLLETLQNLAK